MSNVERPRERWVGSWRWRCMGILCICGIVCIVVATPPIPPLPLPLFFCGKWQQRNLRLLVNAAAATIKKEVTRILPKRGGWWRGGRGLKKRLTQNGAGQQEGRCIAYHGHTIIIYCNRICPKGTRHFPLPTCHSPLAGSIVAAGSGRVIR